MEGFAMLRGIFCAFAISLLTASVAPATTWYVPDDFTTIQGAVSSSAVVDGDTVLVRPGTYVENIDFLGKAITVKSEEGPQVTLIDGDNNGSVVTFKSGEGEDAVLEGFTITNGSGTIEATWFKNGGGVYIHSASPTIEGNIITNNVIDMTYNSGGGIYCYNSSAVIRDNKIIGNILLPPGQRARGAGVAVFNSSNVLLIGNIIAENQAGDGTSSKKYAAYGGGVGFWNSTGSIINSMIVRNMLDADAFDQGAGVIVQGHSTINVLNSTIADNDVFECGFMDCYDMQIGEGNDYGHANVYNSIIWHHSNPYYQWSSITAKYSNVIGGITGNGNIDQTPSFVEHASGDYHLRLNSPCRNSGNDDYIPAWVTTDFEGDDRIREGAVDMGADELLPEIAARFGTVNAGGEGLANVLLVNESGGSRERIRNISVGEAINIRMQPPPAGPEPAPFALYAWVGANEASDVAPHPFGLGTMCFPTLLSGGDPQPYRIWNNIGKEPWLGTAHFLSEPAPSIVASAPAGWPREITLTLQGFILDDGSAANKPASITNAVILKVVE
jgi:hypothetical protein